MKHFDRIDIIFIVLISIYLLVLFIGILWFILDRIEKKYCLTKKNVTLVEEKKILLKNKITINSLLLLKNKHLSKSQLLLKLKKPQVKQTKLRRILIIKLNLPQLKSNQTILKEKLDMYHQLKERKLINAKKGHLRNSLNVFFCFFNYIYRAMFCF